MWEERRSLRVEAIREVSLEGVALRGSMWRGKWKCDLNGGHRRPGKRLESERVGGVELPSGGH